MITTQAVVQGLFLGLVYGVLAVGLVVVYRVSGVVNFAHGATGALGAAVLAKLVLDEHWSFPVAAVLVLIGGAVLGAATQLIARRLAGRPKLMLLVATIGLSQLLLVAQLLLPSIHEVASYPTLLHRRWALGSVVLTGRDFVPLAVVPAIVVGLVIWLASTPSGRAMRAVGEDPDAAELCGIRAGRVGLGAWALAGALATVAAVLAGPLQGTIVGQPSESAGVGLLVRALAAGMVGRMRSLPLAMAGGLAVGVIQAVADSGHVDPAVADLLMLVWIVAIVVVRPTESATDSGDQQLTSVPPASPLTFAAIVTRVAAAVLVVAVAAAVARPSQLFSLSRLALYALVGISLVVLTGWAGQLSLGQFALCGVGTFGAAALEQHGVPLWGAVIGGAGLGGVVSLAVGLPALRVRGVELAVTTLALAVAASNWLFTRSSLLDAGNAATVTGAGGPRAFFLVCAGALGLGVVAAMVIRRVRLGRAILAVRGNERRAAVLGLSPTRTKLIAFVVSGVLAGLAGVLLGALRVHSTAGDFTADESLRIVAVVVIGGAGSVAGALIGAVVVLGIPAIWGSTTIAGLLPSGIGLLVLTVFFPGGLIEITRPFVRRSRSAPTAISAATAASVAAHRPAASPAALEVRELTVRFGGRVALDAVDLVVAPGEAIGIVGANGAGKTTLLDAVSGFVVPAAGAVLLDDVPLRGSPAARARAGLARAVQDARLFDDLTVSEAVSLGGDGAPWALQLLGLEGVGPTPCQDLSTGTRRLVELACVLAGRPRVVLLDEPAAGLSRAEVDALSPVLARIRAEVGATMVVVEHDIELVAGLADRLVVLEAGQVVASGPSAQVLADLRLADGDQLR